MTAGNADLFFDIFNGVGTKYRTKFLDHEISKNKIKELEKSWKINSTIKYVVTGRKLKNFNKSLIHVDSFQKLFHMRVFFFLGLNALQLRYNKLAMAFLMKLIKKLITEWTKIKSFFGNF